jgi:hypothetical protein
LGLAESEAHRARRSTVMSLGRRGNPAGVRTRGHRRRLGVCRGIGTHTMLVEVVAGLEGDWRRSTTGRSSAAEERTMQKLL